MEADVREKIQLFLAIAIALAAIRTGYILYERKTESQPAPKQETALNPDYYVVPRKLYPYDLKSAQQLTKQPVWVKVGYSIARYPYNETTRKSDFKHQEGMLGPLQKINIKKVVLDATPDSPGQRQVMAVFDDNGKAYSFPIGSLSDGNYHFLSDDMLFIQDPHELYKHWPVDVWTAIDQHQVKKGMSQLQADFAIGLGQPESSGDSTGGALWYSNGGKPLEITYQNDKAIEIREAKTKG